MMSMDGEYACNFQAIDKPLICANIPSIKYTDWLDDLHDKNILPSNVSSDLDNKDNSIGLLIDADICGKLMMGSKHDLANGLTVVEFRLGCTVMGKVESEKKHDTGNKVISMFINDAKVSDLRDLDILGIRDIR